MQIRVSSVISNSPIILILDCDMYSNNSECIREALCFLLDEEQGQPIAFVQYPQDFENINSYDIYGNSLSVHNAVSFSLCLSSSIETCWLSTFFLLSFVECIISLFLASTFAQINCGGYARCSLLVSTDNVIAQFW
jgi:Cellulose synthase